MFGSRVKLNVCRASRFTLVGSGKGESGGSGAAAIKVEEHVAQTRLLPYGSQAALL